MIPPHPVLFLAQADGEQEVSRSLTEYIAQGGPIGVIIILLSIVAAGLIFAQLLRLRTSKLIPDDAIESLHALLASGKVRDAIAFCAQPENDSLVTRVLGGALRRCERSPFGFLELRSAVEEAGAREIERLHRMTDGIGLVASVAPMLGLLGTVVGMVGAFDVISVTEGPARPDQLAGNISEALITTVLGLIVAIPCTAAYTFLRNRIDHLVGLASESLEELAAHLESPGRQPPQNAPARPTQPQPAPRPAQPPQPGVAGGNPGTAR